MSRARSAGIVLFAFAISRVLYYAAGIRFDATPVLNHWQFIDPELMKHHLLQSLWYLHMQPPGWNLLVGAVVKVFPSAYPAVLQVLYLILGVLIALCLLWLMDLFRVPLWIATTFTVL